MAGSGHPEADQSDEEDPHPELPPSSRASCLPSLAISPAISVQFRRQDPRSEGSNPAGDGEAIQMPYLRVRSWIDQGSQQGSSISCPHKWRRIDRVVGTGIAQFRRSTVCALWRTVACEGGDDRPGACRLWADCGGLGGAFIHTHTGQSDGERAFFSLFESIRVFLSSGGGRGIIALF